MTANHLQMCRRGEHAEAEACRLIGAVLTADERVSVPALAVLCLLPADLSDIGGLPELALEIIRRDRVNTAEGVVLSAMARGLDVCGLGLGSFLAGSMDNPSCQPDEAVQSVVNFSTYCEQIRAAERLRTWAWQGKKLALPA